MARLPVPGSDDGQWGDILNDFLSQTLNSSGGLKAGTVGAGQLQDNSVTSVALAPGAVTKSGIGLGNVDNTSDANKPISTAMQTALAGKASTASLATVANTGAYSDLIGVPVIPVSSVAGRTGSIVLSKSDVGLGNVDNTADLNKPVSTATQAALDMKVSSGDLDGAVAARVTDDDSQTFTAIKDLLSNRFAAPPTPTILTSSSNYGAGNATISLPPNGFAAGDLLLLYMASDYNATSFPSGWATLMTENTSYINHTFIAKTATNADLGSTVTVNLAGSDHWTIYFVAIRAVNALHAQVTPTRVFNSQPFVVLPNAQKNDIVLLFGASRQDVGTPAWSAGTPVITRTDVTHMSQFSTYVSTGFNLQTYTFQVSSSQGSLAAAISFGG